MPKVPIMKKIIIFLFALLPFLSLSAENFGSELLACGNSSSVSAGTTKSKKSTKKTSKTSNRSSSSNGQKQNQSGPEWLNGTWKCNATISTMMGTIRSNATVYINTQTRQIVAVDNGVTVAKGTYSVMDNTIYAPSDLYINIDVNNKRLEYGNGYYYTKTSDTSYLGN